MKNLFAILLLCAATAFGQSNFPSGIKTNGLNITGGAFQGTPSSGVLNLSGLTSLTLPSGVAPYWDDRSTYLPSFTLRKTVASIAGVSAGISGATYNASTGTVFIVRNVSAAAGNIYEMTTDGVLLRTITNSNFEDTEAIEWVCYDVTNACDVFLVCEEDATVEANAQRISLVRLTRAATTLNRTATGNVSALTAYSNGTINNLGLESICYDRKNGKVYYTIEKRTMPSSDNTTWDSVTGTGNAKIFQRTITPLGTMAIGTETQLCSILPLFTGGTLTDISDMSFDNNTGTILLLSDESDKTVRLSLTGAIIEQLATPGGQPEGVALDDTGQRLWVTGEAQEFYRYEAGTTWQLSSSPLDQLSAMSTTGIMVKGASSIVGRTMTSSGISSSTAGINISFADGVSGAPDFQLTGPYGGFSAYSRRSVAATPYTLVGADNGRTVVVNVASAVVLNVPTGLADGFKCRIINIGAGAVTVTPVSTTVTNLGASLVLNQNAMAELESTASNVYFLGRYQ